jgi:ActR/RegA family two-component response regulator
MCVPRILVVSQEPVTARFLTDNLLAGRFEVTHTRPGGDFLAAAITAPVSFAVIEGIDERPHAAQLEIAVLKQLHPEVQIIAVSGGSSEKDACIVEQGIFYYLAGQSTDKLLRVITAAADAALTAPSPVPSFEPDRPRRP